ncbi:MAG: tetratricopeptide repeat protein [Bacteroidales bacterium]|nr:tetratricopeptide repeat protein [Bacteroidales bacterium]
MAANKKGEQGGIENIEHALSRTEQLIENNQKTVTIVFIVILAIVAGFLGVKKYYIGPKEKEAQEQMFMAEKYFGMDSIRLALEGDGNYLGFLDIRDEYKITKSGKLSNYYIGICYLRMGDYEEAIDYLKKYKTKSKIIGPIAAGAIGDAYVELDELEEGLSYYLKAIDKNDNDFTAPLYMMKAGLVYEELGEYDEALKLYEKLELEYPFTSQGRQINKYISRVKVKLNS